MRLRLLNALCVIAIFVLCALPSSALAQSVRKYFNVRGRVAEYTDTIVQNNNDKLVQTIKFNANGSLKNYSCHILRDGKEFRHFTYKSHHVAGDSVTIVASSGDRAIFTFDGEADCHRFTYQMAFNVEAEKNNLRKTVMSIPRAVWDKEYANFYSSRDALVQAGRKRIKPYQTLYTNRIDMDIEPSDGKKKVIVGRQSTMVIDVASALYGTSFVVVLVNTSVDKAGNCIRATGYTGKGLSRSISYAK